VSVKRKMTEMTKWHDNVTGGNARFIELIQVFSAVSDGMLLAVEGEQEGETEMKFDTLPLYVIGALAWLALGIGVLNLIGSVVSAALRSMGV